MIQFQTENTKKRSNFKQYFLPVNGEKDRVCQGMYANTLSIGHSRITTALSNKDSNGLCGKQNSYSGRTAHNKTPQSDLDIVHEHISSFPVVESHYCRASSKKLYLPAELKNVSFIYKLYQSYCLTKNVKPVSQYVYSRVFNSYNLSFHVPKKDQCVYCNKYKLKVKSGTLSPSDQVEYEARQKRKTESRS